MAKNIHRSQLPEVDSSLGMPMQIGDRVLPQRSLYHKHNMRETLFPSYVGQTPRYHGERFDPDPLRTSEKDNIPPHEGRQTEERGP